MTTHVFELPPSEAYVLLPGAEPGHRLTLIPHTGPVVVEGTLHGSVVVGGAGETFVAREFPVIGVQWHAASDAGVALGLYDGYAAPDGNLYFVRAFLPQGSRCTSAITMEDVRTWIRNVFEEYGDVLVAVVQL